MTRAATRPIRREDLVRSLAEAVEAVPGVARLHPGGVVETATHFAGGKVVGIRFGRPVEIHIEADRFPLPPIATEVIAAAHAVLAAAGDDRPVTVYVDEIAAGALDRRRRR